MRRILLFILAFSYSLQAQDAVQTEKIDQYMQAAVKAWNFNGTVLVAQKGNPVYAKGMGNACYQFNVENTSSTLYRIGGISALFTSVAVLQLAQVGLINLSAPIGDYIKQFPSSSRRVITIQHLLNNTSGLPDYTLDPQYEKLCPQTLTQQELLNLFINKPLEFDPGSRFSFSNSNAIVLGWLIESVTGISFDGYIKQHILSSLNMQNTAYYNSRDIISNLAYGYSLGDQNQIINAPPEDNSRLYSYGGYYSTVADLLLFLTGINSDSFINSYSQKLLMTPKLGGYGVGLYVDDAKAKRDDLFMNNFQKKHCWLMGKIHGYISLVSFYPSEDVQIIILSNNDWGFRNAQLFYTINDALGAIMFNQPYPPPITSVLAEPR